jgi:LuxR family maltose regulon positive regulatory protein
MYNFGQLGRQVGEDAVNEPILITKLHRPEPRPRLVERARLLDLLDRGLAEQRRLTLISAPAGYGKTTLVSDWLQRLQHAPQTAAPWAMAWLGLDEDDDDPARFFRHLVAGLRRACTGFNADASIGAATLDLATSPHQAEISAIMTPLVNELAVQPLRLLLITTRSARRASIRRWIFSAATHRPTCTWCCSRAPIRRCRWQPCAGAGC